MSIAMIIFDIETSCVYIVARSVAILDYQRQLSFSSKIPRSVFRYYQSQGKMNELLEGHPFFNDSVSLTNRSGCCSRFQHFLLLGYPRPLWR